MVRWYTGGKLITAAAGMVLLLAAVPACGAEATPPPVPTATPQPMEAAVMPGIVPVHPPGVRPVNIALGEWAVAPEQPSVESGQSCFPVENRRPAARCAAAPHSRPADLRRRPGVGE